jgi:hypothetical protein
MREEMRELATRLWEGTRNRGTGHIAGVAYEAHQCGTCGVKWAIELDYMDDRREDGEGWKCPNGHSFVYNGGESRADQLARQLAQEQRRRQATEDLLRHEEASHRTTKGHVTRKKRELLNVKGGVCPVEGCHRHFQNVQRHIATKHPNYKP